MSSGHPIHAAEAEDGVIVAPIDKLGPIGIRIRHQLLDWICLGTPVLTFLQRYRTPKVTSVMQFFTFLGLEDFFTPLILLLLWVLDAQFGMLFTLLLAFGFYSTSFLKCLLCMPRPPCPPVSPVTKECKDWAVPSNHSVMAILMPWYIWDRVYNSGSTDTSSFSLAIIFLLLLTWTIGVNISRLYLGVHSVVDMVAGNLVGASILHLFLRYHHSFYDCYLTRPIVAGVLWLVMVGVLLYIHPRTWPETQSFGETVTTLSSSLGMVLGGSVPLFASFHPTALLTHSPSFSQILLYGSLRFVLGVVLVLGFRTLMKRVMRGVCVGVCGVLGVLCYSYSDFAKQEKQPSKHYSSAYRLPHLSKSDNSNGKTKVANGITKEKSCSSWLPESRRPLDIDIPVKLVVYTGVGWIASQLCPYVFHIIGI